MTFDNVKSFVVGTIKQAFQNKQTLDKFTENEEGKVLYAGAEIATDIKISEEEGNAIQKQEDGSLFVADKTEQLERIETELSPKVKYHKYLNTQLEYGYFSLSEMQQNVNDIVLFDTKFEGNIEINNGLIKLKANKTYRIAFALYGQINSSATDAVYQLYNNTTSEFIGRCIYSLPMNYNGSYNSMDGSEYIYTPSEDCEVCIKYVRKNYYTRLDVVSYLTVQEIGREIVIDELEHVNTSQGIEDTPVGHIIAHMGNTAPKHYLVCDGTEYNVADYPHLAQHIEESFGTVNHFGGDGITTFAVPDLRERFLKGSEEPGINQEAGLPDITGYLVTWRASGAFHSTTNETSSGLASGPSWRNVAMGGTYFNASKSSPVYGNSETVTPANTSILYCIKYEPTYFMVRNNTNYIQPNMYSEEEKIVGSWINGKPLYQKTIQFDKSLLTNTGWHWLNHGIENIDMVYIKEGYVIGANGSVCMPVYPSTVNIGSIVNATQIGIHTNEANTKATSLTIQYTKTTDEENSFDKSMLNYFSSSYTNEEIRDMIKDILGGN